MKLDKSLILSFVGVVAIIGLWYLLSFSYSQFLIPYPHETFYSLYSLLQTGNILVDFGYTFYKTLVAYVIAGAIGIPLGILLGLSKKLFIMLQPIVDFFRSIPATAIFPVFLLLFGLGDEARILIAVFSGSLIIIINSMYGVQNANKARLVAVKTMKATQFQTFRYIVFFEALPYIFVGLRQSLSIVLIIVIVTEMLFGGNNGLGYKIVNFYDLYKIPEMYATIILAGFLGYILNVIFVKFEKRIVHWTGV